VQGNSTFLSTFYEKLGVFFSYSVFFLYLCRRFQQRDNGLHLSRSEFLHSVCTVIAAVFKNKDKDALRAPV